MKGIFPCNKDINILHALSQIHTERRVLLSGTLFLNNFKEFFNLLRLVRPNILDLNSFQAFFIWLFSIITATERHPKLMYRGHVQDTVERIFSEVLGYALQSNTEEVKTFTIEYTTLTRNPYIPISYVTFLQVKIYIKHIHFNILRDCCKWMFPMARV